MTIAREYVSRLDDQQLINLLHELRKEHIDHTSPLKNIVSELYGKFTVYAGGRFLDSNHGYAVKVKSQDLLGPALTEMMDRFMIYSPHIRKN